MQFTRIVHCLMPLALMAAAIATPARLTAQASENLAASTYRLTAAGLKKFTKATRDLAAAERKNPGSVSLDGSQMRPESARILASSGMSRDEYLRFFVALFDAAAAQYIMERDAEVSAQIPGITKVNASFVKKNQEAVDALGPDIKTLQDIGED